MNKKKITQWEYNKLKRLLDMIMVKHLDAVINDIAVFCEDEGLDIEYIKVKLGLHGKKI